MLGQLDRVATAEHDEGSTREDVFRRATFNWALATKKMVDSSNALGMSARVAHAALVDIENARAMLEELFIPVATKSPAVLSDNDKTVTSASVQESVSGMVARILTFPQPEPPNDGLFTPYVVDTPHRIDAVIEKYHQPPHLATNLANAVWPKDGKLLWAGIDCPTCHVKAGQRCQTQSDGKPRAKPHESRKRITEQGSNS